MKDNIDNIIDIILEHTTVTNVCSSCDDGQAMVDDFKNQYHPVSDYDKCRQALKKLGVST